MSPTITLWLEETPELPLDGGGGSRNPPLYFVAQNGATTVGSKWQKSRPLALPLTSNSLVRDSDGRALRGACRLGCAIEATSHVDRCSRRGRIPAHVLLLRFAPRPLGWRPHDHCL